MGYLCPHPCWNQPATCDFSSCKILRPRERLLLFPKKPLSLLLFFYLHLFGFWGSPTWDNCCLDQMWRLLCAERRESRKTSMFFKEKRHFSIIIGLLLFSVSKLSFPFTRSRTNKIVWAVCSCFHSFHSFFFHCESECWGSWRGWKQKSASFPWAHRVPSSGQSHNKQKLYVVFMVMKKLSFLTIWGIHRFCKREKRLRFSLEVAVW